MTRGRNADTPSEIPASGWWDVILRLKKEVSDDRVGLIAAGIAFYGLLALFPAIGALIAVSGLLIDAGQVVEQIGRLQGIVPDEVLSIVTSQATGVAGAGSGGLGLAAIFGILLSLYSASKGMASLMEGINVAYDETETRGFVHLKLVTLGLTLFLILGLLVAVLAMIGLPIALTFLSLGEVVETLMTGALWVGLFLLTVFGLSVLYRYGPSRDAPEWTWASIGAVSGTAVWLIASAAFAFYVSNFGAYNESFGTLAGVIVLLMWFWISAFVIILGAELNAEAEAQTAQDTTRGPDERMGRRDAVKADNLGEAAGK